MTSHDPLSNHTTMRFATIILAAGLFSFAGCSDTTDSETSTSNSASVPGDNAAPAAEHGSYTDVTDASIDAFLASSDVAVLELWATWCGPCKIMGPRFEAVAKELQADARFGKVDIDNNPNIVSKYKIRSIPSVLIIKNGRLVDTLVGVQPQEKLAAQISAYL